MNGVEMRSGRGYVELYSYMHRLPYILHKMSHSLVFQEFVGIGYS